MKYKTYTVEIITPTIMGGADSGKLDPYKIRTSEIKSAMRQVFRMIAGKYIDHSPASIKLLLEKEGEIFGSTSGKSTFKIWTEGTENLKTQKIKLLPHKSDFSKEAVLPNQQFRINLLIYSDNIGIKFYESLLKLALLLGIGNRKNRLMGNMKLKEETLNIKEDAENISTVCQKMFNTTEKLIEKPLYPTLSLRPGNEKNYLFLSIPLKKEYISKELLFETLLKDLYKKIIEPTMKSNFKDIIGSANPRQGSYINFSVYKDGEDYKLFMIGFYYENNRFDYKYWKKAIEEIKKIYQEQFKQ